MDEDRVLLYALGKNRVVKSEIRHVKVTDLHYYIQNPRISSIILNLNKNKITDKDIDKIMYEKQADATRTLYRRIKEDGRVNEPVIVYNNLVIEGNTRLWVVRALYGEAESKTEKDKWLYVPCRVITDKLTEDDINSMLINTHIKKKKDWEPYEQACYFDRLKQDGYSHEDIAEKADMSASKVSDYIRAFKEMRKNKVASTKEFEYYYETFRQPEVKKAISKKNLPVFEVLNKKIKEGKIKKASDVRKITTILLDTRATKAFFKGDADIARAEEMSLRHNPQERDVLLKDIRNLTEDLKQIHVERLEAIGKNPEELKILTDLAEQIKAIFKTLRIKF